MITCALSPDQIQDLRVYNIAKLLGKIERNESFNLKQHLVDVYQTIYDGTKDHNTALDYARVATSLTMSAVANLPKLEKLQDLGLDISELFTQKRKAGDETTGLQSTADFLGIDRNKKETRELLKQNQNTEDQIEAAEKKNNLNVKVIVADTLKPINPISTTIDETVPGTEAEMAYYTEFVKTILQNNEAATDSAPIPYSGVEGGLVLKLVPHKSVPIEQLHPNIKEKVKAGVTGDKNADHYNNGYVFIITDVNGKEVLFNANYEVAETGKIIYFKSRFLPKKAEGAFDLTQLANVQSPAEIAKNTGQTVEAARQYLQDAFTTLEKAYNYLSLNPDNSIIFSITGGSLGAIVDPVGTTFQDIVNLKAPITKLTFLGQGKKNTTAFSGVYARINEADYALKIKEISEKDADQLADLLLIQSVVDKDGKELDAFKRAELFRNYVKANEKAGLILLIENKILRVFVVEDGVKRELRMLPTTYEQDKKDLVNAILNGPGYKKQYNPQTSSFNLKKPIEFFNLEQTDTGAKITITPLNSQEYLNHIVESINADLNEAGVPKRANAYFTVLPLDSENEKLELQAPAPPVKTTLPIQNGTITITAPSTESFSENWTFEVKDGKLVSGKHDTYFQGEYRDTSKSDPISNLEETYKTLSGIEKYTIQNKETTPAALEGVKPVELKPLSKKEQIVKDLKEGKTVTGEIQKPTFNSTTTYEFVKPDGTVIYFYDHDRNVTPDDLTETATLKLLDKLVVSPEKTIFDVVEVYVGNKFLGYVAEKDGGATERTIKVVKEAAKEIVKRKGRSSADSTILNEILNNKDLHDKNKLGLQQSLEATQEQIKQAKIWYEKSPLSKHIPFEVMFNAVNIRTRGSIATWNIHGITLFKGSDYSDLYHEAWHGFTQMFMTKAQRDALYKEAASQSGTFVTFEGKTVEYSKATEEELEEKLAEDFREYMLKEKPVTQPVKKSIFQKILDFLKALFGKSTIQDAVDNFTNNPIINELYAKLKVGNLTEYTFDQANYSFGTLNSKRNSGITNYEDLQLVSDSIDSLFAELSTTLNKERDTKRYTLALIKDSWGRKMAYKYAEEQFTARLQELLEEKKELGPDVTDTELDYAVDLLTRALANFGNSEDLSNPTGLIADHMALSRLIAFEDKLIDAEVDVTKKNEFESKAGNEVGMQKLADSSLLYTIRSLSLFDKNNELVINRLGFGATADFDSSWKRFVNITKESKDVNDIYNRLTAVAEIYPVIKEFLNRVGNPNSTEKSTQNLWTEIEKLATMPEIQLMNLQIAMKKNDKSQNIIEYITPAVAAGEAKKIGNAWNNAFAQAPASDYITKSSNKVNSLNIKSVLRTFAKGVNKDNMFEFMSAVGMPLEDNEAVREAAFDSANGILKEVIAIRRALGAINEYNDAGFDNKIVIERPTDILKSYRQTVDEKTSSSLKGELGGAVTKMTAIQNFQLNWSDTFTSSTVNNANGEQVQERSQKSTLSNQITDINAAETLVELTQEGVENGDKSMNHLSQTRNPFAKNLILLKRLFDEKGNKRRNKKGQKVKIELMNMSGTSVLQKEIDGIINSSGIGTSESDYTSRYLNEFYMTMLHGASVATQHADKSMAYLYRVVNSDGGTHYIKPSDFAGTDLSSAGSTLFVNQLVRYLSSEYERIRLLKSGDPSGSVTVGKSSTYLERGSKFVIFDKILSEQTKNSLYMIWSFSNPVDTAEEFMKYLNRNLDLKNDIQNQILNYLGELANSAKTELTDIGLYNSDALLQPILNKMATDSEKKLFQPGVKTSFQEAIPIAFVANSWLHKYETTLLLYGDPALYDDVDDFFKRNAGIAATGDFSRTDTGMLDFINTGLNEQSYAMRKYGITPKQFGKTLTSAVLEDTKTKSEYYDDYVNAVINSEKLRLKGLGVSNDIIEETIANTRKIFSDAYEGMKEGDGQGWINFDAYRSVLKSMNKWSNYQEELYLKIINGQDISKIDIKQFFPIKKMQYWGPLDIKGLPVTGFHKFSLMPLIPNLIQGSSFDILQKKMLEQGVDYALFQSGSKLNSVTTNGKIDKFYVDNTSNTDRTPAFASDTFKFTPNNVFLRYFKDQIEVSETYKGTTTFSSQMRKLIEYGLVENGIPTDWKREITNKEDRLAAWKKTTKEEKEESRHYRLYTEYEKTLDDYVKYEVERLRKDIGNDTEKLVAFIKKELSRKELTDHAIDFIDIDPKTKKLKHDLDVSLDADNIEKMLVALIQKRLINHKFNGEGLIQVSGTGFEKSDRVVRVATADELTRMSTNGLPFYSNPAWVAFNKLENPSEADLPTGSSTTPIGIMISMQGNFKKLLKLKEVQDLARKNTIDPLSALNILIKDETWLNTGNNRKFITSIAVRIPVQNLNSMEYMQITEFKPESSGNLIVLPAEIVAKSGGDFDIDKMFTMFPNIKGKTVLAKETLDIISAELNENFSADRMNYILDKKDNNLELTEIETKALNIFEETGYEIEEVTLAEGNNGKGLQNKILYLAAEILSLDYNFPNLITPNTTITMKDIADKMFEKKAGRKKAKPKLTEIFEVKQNVDKQQANSIGKTILGIIAVSNTFNTIFDRTGLLLEKTQIVNPDAKTINQVTLNQTLLLDHNTVNGQISMSSLHSKDGTKRIADLISQLINGSVDVAKAAWIFDIQGNKELINSLVFMVMAGVDPQQAINFISQPIIGDYVKLQKKYKSPFSVPITNIDHGINSRNDARDTILFNYNSNFPFTERTVTRKGKDIIDKGLLFSELEKYVEENKQLITPENLDKNVASKEYTVIDRVVFAHFLQIEAMASKIKDITQNLNFDTAQTKTLFDARNKMNDIYDFTNGVAKEYIDAIINESPIGAFTIQPFMYELLKDLFPLRTNETINQYIDRWYNKPNQKIYNLKKQLGLSQDDDVIRKFRTDLISFIFQNSYYKFNPNTPTYNGQNTEYSVVNQLSLNTIAGVKNGVLYVDKTTLKESFISKNYANENAWLYDVAPVNSSVFEIYANTQAEALYTKFVYERETIRQLEENSFEKIKNTKDFTEYYDEAVKQKKENPEKRAYESVLRDRALANTNLHVPMFYGNKAFAVQVMNLEELHPELAAKYYILQRLQSDTIINGKSTLTNLKFMGVPTPQELNRMHSDILNLSDPSVIKVEDAEENLRISKLFQKFTHFALLQSGIDQRSSFSLIKVAPEEQFITLIAEPKKEFLKLMNDRDLKTKATDLLVQYENMFIKQYEISNGKLKNRIKNYAVSSSASDIKIPVESKERVFDLIGETAAEETITQIETSTKTISEAYGVIVSETNPTQEKTQEFINLIQPQIQAQAYKENASGTANDMFMYGLRWTRKSKAKMPLNNKSYANGGLPITDAKAKDNYVYDTVDQNGNPLAPLSDLQPIINEIQNSLGIDMSNYDAVIGNIYLPGQNIATHRDTTESLSARNYPVVVYTIGNNSGIGVYENEKNPGSASFASDKKTMIPTKDGTIYTFGMDGKGRFELAHDTPKEVKRDQKFPPIQLPNGNYIENYTITLTFRRAADLEPGIPKVPAKTTTQIQAPVSTETTTFPTKDKFLVAKNKSTGILTYRRASTAVLNEADVKLLKQDYPGVFFLVNGFDQLPGKRYTLAGNNSILMTLGQDASDFVRTKALPNTNKSGVANLSAPLSDATYEANIKQIDEDLARWKEKQDNDKILIFDDLGYGQSMIGRNEDKITDVITNATAPRTFNYLSAKLLEMFGYLNPNYISTPEGSIEVQKYQYVTDEELIEQKKVCKL